MKKIRTPTEAKGGITPEEKVKMDVIVTKWKANAFRTTPIDKDKITDAIYRLYEAAGLKRPRVVIVPSPYTMALSYGLSAGIWYLRKNNNAATRAATYDATYAATRDATYDATDDATDAATRAATYDATYAATRDATDDATRAATYAATRDATDDATRAATLKKQHWLKQLGLSFVQNPKHVAFLLSCIVRWWNVYQGGNMWSGIGAFFDAIKNVIGLTGLQTWGKYQAYEDAMKEGGFRVMHEEFCIVSDFPEILTIDDRNRVHNEHGPSHRWRDGYEIYHLHGVRFPKELYLKVVSREMNMADILKIQDIDQRVQAMKFAKNGLREFYESEGGKMIDHYVKMDNKGRPINYELWQIPEGKTFDKIVHFAIYDCPSARERGEKREYSKGVPAFKTIAECMAWGMSDETNVLTPQEWQSLTPLIHES